MMKTIKTTGKMGLAPPMLIALVICLTSFTLLYAYLLLFRMQLGKTEYFINEIKTLLYRRP